MAKRWYRLRETDAETRLGFAVAVFALLVLTAAFFGVYATLQLQQIARQTQEIAQQTRALIISGTSPSAQRLAIAASQDKDLLCAVLAPLADRPGVSARVKFVIKQDC